MMRRWKVTCSYDGTDFNGWQIQPTGVSVQGVLQKRLAFLLKEPVKIHASGRTDAGVHARGQVFHFDANWTGDGQAFQRAIGATLAPAIVIDRVAPVADSFHSRFSAVGKLYKYRFYLGEVPPHLSRYVYSRKVMDFDLSKMKAALKLFEGWHDFRSFACNRGKPYVDTIRFIQKAELIQNGKSVCVAVEGNGFMYKMVRTMVGAAFQVQSGKIPLSDISDMLTGVERKHEINTAPACGLTLEKVYYRNRHYPSPP